MSTDALTCDLVDESDIDTRYLAGQLSEEQSEAFESHYFECQRCWALVEQGLSVRAAFDGVPQPVPAPHEAIPPTIKGWRYFGWGLAAAAALVITAVGVRQAHITNAHVSDPEALRGGGMERFRLSPAATIGSVSAAWPKLPKAQVYRVRLYTEDGTVIAEHETADTSISLGVDVLTRVPEGHPAYWQVQGLDAAHDELARSELTKAALPSNQSPVPAR
jgi:hypothetical protein